MKRTESNLEGVGRNTPLRLMDAARIAFPGGGITAASLRKERDRGTLTVERIAGKDFTTLAAIDQMRELCRVVPKSVTTAQTAAAEELALAAALLKCERREKYHGK